MVVFLAAVLVIAEAAMGGMHLLACALSLVCTDERQRLRTSFLAVAFLASNCLRSN